MARAMTFAVVCGAKTLKKYVGTPAYLAPELVAGTDAGYLGRPVDMWALGCTLYEMLHGRLAFSGEPHQVGTRIRAAKHDTLDPSVPAAAKALLGALLTKDVSKRPSATATLAKGWLKQTEVGMVAGLLGALGL